MAPQLTPPSGAHHPRDVPDDVKARRFAHNDSGAAALIFAVALIPIVLLVGSAIDYQRAVNARTRMQSALDSATLAGAKGASPSERYDIAAKFFTVNAESIGADSIVATFGDNADGTFGGSASGTVKTTMMSIATIQTLEVRTTSAAIYAAPSTATAPISLNFVAKRSTGWYYKEITLFTHYPGDATDTKVASWAYQPVNLKMSSGTVSGPLNTPIPIGGNYDNLYLTMFVSTDGCPMGQVPLNPNAFKGATPYNTTNFQCAAEATSYPTTANRYTFATNDPATVGHIFVDGVKQSVGSSYSVNQFVKCGKTVTQAWEDTFKDDGTPSWTVQDFVFDVTGGACTTNPAVSGSSQGTRLVK